VCGIAGYSTRNYELPTHEGMDVLSRMNEVIAHRGPDGSGVMIDGVTGFAHRRLAIIDLNQRSDQPMRTACGRLMVAFNGEIYNFKELRKELSGRGYSFSTSSDTEVLLHGYNEWGSDLPLRLRGMFAFAIWDKSKQELFLARDRFGKKPLYYYNDGNTFLFGSEIKSLLRWPGLHRKINYSSIHDYMTYGYCIGEETAFESIFRLLPGHRMILRANGGAIAERYWTLPECNDSQNISVSEACGQLIEHLDEALRIRLISDVPLGAFLSGG